MLTANRQRVVQDITNPGPENIDGKPLTQKELERVPDKNKPKVDAMLREVCSRLEGKAAKSPGDDAMVWASAARYLSKRIQASPGEKPGRMPDMSPGAAAALRKVLKVIDDPRLEAAQLLSDNRERVVQDITNPGPKNIDGKALTQRDLKRVGGEGNQAKVDGMVREVCFRLQGKSGTIKPGNDAMLWAEAARYLSKRIQGSTAEHTSRKPDMSPGAAAALRAVLDDINDPGLEAAQMLMNNHEKVVLDIVNPGPKNINGKTLTQTELVRVGSEHKAKVDAMVKEVCMRLQGKASNANPGNDKAVWAAAATYLSKRVQGRPGQMPGRKPDMSSGAAEALRAVLKEL